MLSPIGPQAYAHTCYTPYKSVHITMIIVHSVIEEPHDPAPNSEAAEAPTEDWKPDAAAG